MLRSLTLVAALLTPALAWAEEEENLQEELEAQARKIDVIQNRKYDLLNEIAFLAGGMPSDPFYYGVTGTVGYTLHLGQSVAWELAQFTYSLNFDKKLKQELERTALATGNTAPDLPEITWIISSHLVLKPLYGKQAIFNTEVLHVEAFLQLGPSVLKTTDVDRSIAFGIDLGAGLRFWVSDATSVRIDLGELVYWLPQSGGKASEVKGALHLHLGIAFNLRGED